MTYDQAAAQISEALGQPVRFVDVPDAAAREGMIQAGLPEWVADQIVNVFGELRRGVAANTTDVVRVLTGAEPRTVADFARAYAAAFRPRG